MDTIFTNSKNSKICEPHRLLLSLAHKINLERSGKYFALSNLILCYICKNIKKPNKNNKSKIWAPAWNEKFDLPDGSYSVSDIQDHFECILTKHVEKIDNPTIIYINKTENKITFKIKKINIQDNEFIWKHQEKDKQSKNGENVSHL